MSMISTHKAAKALLAKPDQLVSTESKLCSLVEVYNHHVLLKFDIREHHRWVYNVRPKLVALISYTLDTPIKVFKYQEFTMDTSLSAIRETCSVDTVYKVFITEVEQVPTILYMEKYCDSK